MNPSDKYRSQLPPSPCDTESPRVRKVGEAEEVPVYNCRAYVAPPDESGTWIARAAELDQLEGHGRSEREALQRLVERFKTVIATYRSAGEEIPWVRPAKDRAEKEQERFLAVHL